MIPSNATHEVRMFYGAAADAPKQPGDLALHTWHIGQTSRDMEIAAASSRDDIGRVEWRTVNPQGQWVEVLRGRGRKA